jgi:hypothetical protein
MTRIITSGAAASRWQAVAVLVLVSVFFGLLIGLSPVMTALNYSDSVIPVHLSIERPDTFYWGQSRFGMLVPKLAHGIQDPWTNLFFQQVVTAGFTSFGLLALGCVFGLSSEASLVSGLFVMGALFGSQSGQTLQTLFLIAQPYGLSLGLFVLLVLAERARLGKPGRVLVLSGRSHAIHELVGQAVAKNPGRPLVSGLAAEPDFTRFLDQVFLRSVGTITCESGIRTDALVSTR